MTPPTLTSPSAAALLSVVLPVYNEADVLPALLPRLDAATRGVLGRRELIFVNDGSRDASLGLLLAAADGDDSVRVLDLSRNFGHQAALSAGLAAARGDAVVMMDADLQDPPELIAELVAAWCAGHEVVIAVRRSRAERGPRRLGFEAFHRLFGWLADGDIPSGNGIFGLLDRRVVDELLRLPERNRFLPGLMSWVGFTRSQVAYDRDDRAAGAPKQTFRRLVKYGMDGIFGFSYKPLRLSWMLGFTVSGFFFLYALLLVVLRLLRVNVVVGFTTPTAAIMFLGGVQLLMVGILGEYLARVYDEVKQRPMYIVRSEYGATARCEEPPGRPGQAG
jgi:dolichol-phosphate mannosyltransferase